MNSKSCPEMKTRLLKYVCVELAYETLEPSRCKKWQKSPGQETGLGKRGPLKVLNGTKFVLNEYERPPNHLGSI